jgi:hypothetical protein
MKQTIVYGDRSWPLGSMTVDELEQAGEMVQAPWALLNPAANPAHLIAVLAVLLRRDCSEDDAVNFLARGPQVVSVEVTLHVEDTRDDVH